MSSTDWDHEKSLLLISKFRTHEALWNSNSKSFHSPKMKEDAWWSLAKEMEVPAAEVKRKMECLRGSYRRERSRVRAGIERGRKYLPKWFAYNSLSFLDETRPHDVVNNAIVGAGCDVSNPPSMDKSGYMDSFDYILSHNNYKIPSNDNCESESYAPMETAELEKENPDVPNNMSDPIETSTELQPKDEELSDENGEDLLNQDDMEFIDKKEVLSHGKFKIPRRRRFCGKSPYKPIRSKSKLKKRKPVLDTKPSMDGTVREPHVTSSERSSKVGSGWMERFGDETSQPPVAELEKRFDSSSKSKNTLSNCEGKKLSKAVKKLLESNKLIEKPEDIKTDECTAFGQLVESTLRKLTAVQRVKAKIKLSKVLWEVELEALHDDPPSESNIGVPGT